MRALSGRALLQSRFSLFRGPPRHPRPAALVQLQATSAGWGLNQPLHQSWQRCAASTSAVRAAAVATTPSDMKLAPFSTDIAIDQLTEKGVAQGQRPAIQALASSFLGGAMLGWGGLLMTVVAGGCVDLTPGAIALIKGAVFPVGLSMITLSGSELLTGNMLTQSLPPIGADRAGPVARVLTLSFIGNFAGSLLVVGMAWAGGVFPATGAVASSAAALAVSKTSLAPAAAFVKGIGANWLVATAIVQAQSAHTAPGKIAALWLPIMTFVALGLEHSVANMFLIPLGIVCGADVSVSAFWLNNMLPVLAGNLVGAVLCCGCLQRLTLGRSLASMYDTSARLPK